MPTKPKIKIIGRVSSTSVEKATNKNWDEWIKILSHHGAENLSHQQIVALLKTKYKLTPWWQQGVTHGFEVHIGRRIDGQTAKGDYSVTVTKSMPVSAKAVWKLLNSDEGIRLWLNPMSEFKLKKNFAFEVNGGIFGEVRTVKAPQRARLLWHDEDETKPTYVNIFVVPRPKKKSILVFSHDGIKRPQTREQMRKYWRQAIEQLKTLCSIKQQ